MTHHSQKTLLQVFIVVFYRENVVKIYCIVTTAFWLSSKTMTAVMTLWEVIQAVFQFFLLPSFYYKSYFHFCYLEAKSLYRMTFLLNRNWDLCWFWANWQHWKKWGPIMSNFWGWFFFKFSRAKKIFFFF